MKSTDLYRRNVIQKAAELVKVTKLKHHLKEREIAKGIGVGAVVMCHLKNSNYHHQISRQSIQILADFINNKIYYDGDERAWRKHTPIKESVRVKTEDDDILGHNASTEKNVMETVKKIEEIRELKREKESLVNMSLDDEIADEQTEKAVEKIEKELPLVDFWEYIRRASSVIPSNVSMEIKLISLIDKDENISS